MADEKSTPTPPDVLPRSLVDELTQLDEDLLRATSDYAARLADARDQQGQTGEEELPDQEREGIDREDLPDEPDPSEAPSGATLTTKEINNNKYHYWQWSEGGKTKSEYIRPVSPDYETDD